MESGMHQLGGVDIGARQEIADQANEAFDAQIEYEDAQREAALKVHAAMPSAAGWSDVVIDALIHQEDRVIAAQSKLRDLNRAALLQRAGVQ